MKKWSYISGAVFLICLLGLTYYKTNDRAIPDALFYLFCIVAFIFFFLLIFTALRQKKAD